MDKPKISIIIPVYNTEEYVKEAVLSILHQTIKEIEIIIINDGSTDNSLQVIQELAKSDHRIQIYSQENKGLSMARNEGIKKAKGKYFYFMDSDDLLDREALYSCYQKCEQEQLDFVFFDAEVFGIDETICSYFNYDRAKYVEDRLYQGKEVLNILLEKKKYNASVCLNLIKQSFLQRIELNFYPGIIHEDELFTGILYLKAQRVGCIPKAYFKRRVRSGSIMTGEYTYRSINGYLSVISQLTEQTKDEKEKNIQVIAGKLIRYILDPSVYNAGQLSLKERIMVFSICLHKAYFKYVSPKSILVLLFPFTISIKGFFKNR